jgi:rRNA-processing protein FCF1
MMLIATVNSLVMCAVLGLAMADPNTNGIIHDFVCKKLEEMGDNEEEIAAAVCKTVHESLPTIPEQACETKIKDEWDDIAKECASKNVRGLPDDIKKEIHDLVCKELETTDDEKKVADAVCAKVHAAFPRVPEELCTLGVTHEWDSLASKCKPESLQGIPDVIKKEIHDIVCKELEKTDDEKKVAAAVCAKVHSTFPRVPEELCELGVTHEWDSLTSECKANRLEGIPDVIKKEIHDLVCKELEETDDEKKVTAAVCAKVHAAFPRVPEELCSLAITHEWDSLASECKPKSLQGIPDIIKKEIHDLVCKELEKTDVEDEVVLKACTTLHARFPFIVEAACEVQVKEGWNYIVKACATEHIVV